MPTEKDVLSAANIKYLLALNRLSNEEKGIKCIDIAAMLKVSKPSVHEMMKNMDRLELINKSKYGTVFLTEKGKVLSDMYSGYYYTIREYFQNVLNTSEDISETVAASLTLDMNAEELKVICQRMNKR